MFAASSSRGKYWREAYRVFKDRPLKGVGAGAFEKARLRHRTDQSVTQHAHGWIPQTMADLGLIGLVIATLLMLAWVLAALSATGLVPRRFMRSEGDDEPPPRGATGTRSGSPSSRSRWCRWCTASRRCSTGPGSSRRPRDGAGRGRVHRGGADRSAPSSQPEA